MSIETPVGRSTTHEVGELVLRRRLDPGTNEQQDERPSKWAGDGLIVIEFRVPKTSPRRIDSLTTTSHESRT